MHRRVGKITLDAAFSPLMPLFWRRASPFCKAPLKNSSSKVLSTSTRFNWLISLRSVATPHRGRRDQIDLATCRAAADAHQVPVTIPRCCHRPSIARQPSGGILSDTVPLVSSWPLAVPFPAKCQGRSKTRPVGRRKIRPLPGGQWG